MEISKLINLSYDSFFKLLETESLTENDITVYIQEKTRGDRRALDFLHFETNKTYNLRKIIWDRDRESYPSIPINNLKILLSVLESELSKPCKEYVKTERLCDMIIHKNKEAVLSLLNEWIPGYKTKRVAIVVKALIATKILAYPSIIALHKALQLEFNIDGTASGLTKFLKEETLSSISNPIKDEDVAPFIKALENI